MAQLLLTAVNAFNRDVYTISDISRMVPIEILIKNNVSQEKEYIVKEILPYGVEGMDHDPVPEEGDDLKWKIKIPANSESRITYWVKLPDEINTYEIKTEIYDGETKLDEISLSLEVSQKVLSRIDELITEIDSVEASGSDAHNLKKARQKLQKVRNRSGDSILISILNVKDCVKAAEYIGKVENVDVSLIRAKIQNVMVFYSRSLFDKLKGLSLLNLQQFSTVLIGN